MLLSATIITHNAGTLLKACLKNACFADEIVVVDSGSFDGTVEVVRRSPPE